MDFNAENFRFERPIDDRQKVHFIIKEKEDAKKCFMTFERTRELIPGARHKLYYVRPDEILVKYADIEAAKFYEEQERLKNEEAERLAMKKYK